MTVNMDGPEANNGFVPKLVVQPLGITGVERVTGFWNPLRNVAVIVEVPEDPALMFRDVGAAETVKSGEG